ncbi:MAG: hypothetical protein HN348_21110 [Proteobacteria bacterium]|jgi:hypothetical protein|nr:hypothetical protein [Pseudomonadota bacterium]
MTPEPFAPPREQHNEDSSQLVMVIASWMLAGATAGTSLGATLQLFGLFKGVVVAIAMGTAVVAAIAGAVIFRWERAHSLTHRPAIIDGRGRLSRPLNVWLLGTPILIAIPSLLWLAIVGSLSTDSLFTGFAFLMASSALAWAGRKLISGHFLARGVEALELGDAIGAAERLEILQGRWWATKASRTAAWMNLGVLSVQRGDLPSALYWYELIDSGEATRAFATVGRALVKVLQDEFDEGERLLLEAMTGSASRVIQTQADEVRLLLVLRRDGAEEARQLGERLLGPGAGSLFLGVLAAARARSGDMPGARSLLDSGAEDSLRATGLGKVVPEIRELLPAQGIY